MSFDIFAPVQDWFSNIHVAYNPHAISFKEDDFDANWKRIFQVPFIDQSDPITNKTNPIWKNAREDFICGSEVSDAITKSEEYVLQKTGVNPKVFTEEVQRYMQHGKDKEPLAGMRYTYEVEDITFKFGLIPHQDPKWRFLAVSPDLIALKRNRVVEIKSPYKRCILWKLRVDDIHYSGQNISNDIKVLMRDVLITGEKHKYLTITNLPLQASQLCDKMYYYWHQIQLQWEVLRIGDSIDFVQFGTVPNRYYMSNDLLTITHVPCNDSWIAKYGDILRKTWDEVQYYRINGKMKNEKKNPFQFKPNDDPVSSDDDEECPFVCNSKKRKLSIPDQESDGDDCPFLPLRVQKSS